MTAYGWKPKQWLGEKELSDRLLRKGDSWAVFFFFFLLWNIGYLPAVVQYVLEPILNPLSDSYIALSTYFSFVLFTSLLYFLGFHI